MSGIVSLYYKEHFNTWRHGHRLKRKLREDDMPTGGGDSQKAFATLVSEAIGFFEEKRNEVIDLPMASAERASVESALGLLKQAQGEEGGSENDLRSRISTLREGLMSLVDGADPENTLFRYLTDVAANLSDLYIQAGDAGDAGVSGPPMEEPAAPPDEPAPGGDKSGGEPGGDEEPAPENLATKLGLV